MSAKESFIFNITLTSTNEGDSSDCVLPETLQILEARDRNIFMVVFIVLSIASLAGNCAVIYSIPKRKHRFVQKTCILSLALSDILSTVIIATNNLETFSHDLVIWTLGSFLCSMIPTLQMVGILASSLALMFIAMDRYHNVVHALNKRWNPTTSTCICFTIIMWIVTLGISYPLGTFFSQEAVTIVYIIDLEQQLTRLEEANICISFDKSKIQTYYIIMVNIIFLPLLIVFIFFYYNIASLVWKHRKPVSSCYQNENSNVENSTSVVDIRVKNIRGTERSCRDIKVERKIRTFKIIVTLMLVFIICRLPYFTVYILKLSLVSEYGMWTWYLNYAFLALHIFNCCLNPLLYTFLNQTLTVFIRVKRSVKYFIFEICCFCCSKEGFDQFERENPFVVENCSRNSTVKFQKTVKVIEQKF